MEKQRITEEEGCPVNGKRPLISRPTRYFYLAAERRMKMHFRLQISNLRWVAGTQRLASSNKNTVGVGRSDWVALIVVSHLGNVDLIFHDSINQTMLFIDSSRPKA